MLKGYSLPLSPTGRSSLVPAPPWHYVGNLIVIDYQADPDAVKSFLPSGLELGQDAGKCAAIFADWQACTDGAEELLDPICSQYREFFVLTGAMFDGQAVTSCPFIYVDQDIAMLRGLIQGWPKQLGSVYITRAFGLPSPASPPLGPNGTFAGTLAVKDRRLVDAAVTIEREAASAPSLGTTPIINVRHYPRLEKGYHDQPAVHQLVRSKLDNISLSKIWEGSATLRFYESPNQELHLLAPIEVGTGYVYSMAMTIGDLVELRDLRNNLPA